LLYTYFCVEGKILSGYNYSIRIQGKRREELVITAKKIRAKKDSPIRLSGC
jgi:hypothetical protein